MSDMTSWNEALEAALESHGETMADVESSTLTEEQMNKVFDSGYGSPEGDPFTVWTKSRVYFPTVYDGAEWVASVSRHPDGTATDHIGSW